MRLLAYAALAAGLFAGAAPAQPDAEQAIAGMYDLMKNGRYLDALLLVESAEPPPEMASSFGQMSGTLRAMMGDEAGAIEGFSLTLGSRPASPVEALEGEPFTMEPAIAAIRAEAAGERVVMINEAHNISRHRAFTADLVKALHEDGFRALAAEGFAPHIEAELDANGYPTRAISAYIDDPFFAEMVRTARALGWRLVSYEQQPEQSCRPECSHEENRWQRERVQGENLARFVEANPDTRVLVHAGYMHLSEFADPESPERLYMGGHFQRLTGINPLTIDQTMGTPGTAPRAEPMIEYLEQSYDYDAPSVFLRADGSFHVGAGMVDMTVYHPRLAAERGRPGWIAARGGRYPVEFDLGALPADRPILLQAFVHGESTQAIPLDQLLIETEDAPATLMLPEGSYVIVIQRPGEPDIVWGERDVQAQR